MVSRISTLVGIPSEQAEAMQVAFYDPGQSFAAHYDAFEPAHGGPEAAGGVEGFGNRLVSALGYLTEHGAAAGGETEFTRLGLLVRGMEPLPFLRRPLSSSAAQVQPQVGRLLVFSNIDSDGRRYEESVHMARPLAPGAEQRKWVFNVWFRGTS